jgi:hypothetical protein
MTHAFARRRSLESRCASDLFALVLISLYLARGTAVANCAPGKAVNYSDIDGVAIQRAGMGEPYYHIEVFRNGNAEYLFGLRVTNEGRYLHSWYGEAYEARDAAALFASLVAVLKSHDFYSIRLVPSKFMVIDGPRDIVAVVRCGVTTSLGNDFKEVIVAPDVSGVEWHRLMSLIDDLQSRVHAWPWAREHHETLTPEPTPSP